MEKSIFPAVNTGSKYKPLDGFVPEYLCSNFEKVQTYYNLRDSENKLNVPLPHTNYYQNKGESFSH